MSRLDSAETQRIRSQPVCLALPFGRLWYDTPDNAIGYAMHYSRSQNAVIRVYDELGNVIETHEDKGDFEEF